FLGASAATAVQGPGRGVRTDGQGAWRVLEGTLPYAALELHELAQLHPRLRPVTGAAATPAGLRNALQAPGMVHFVGHGVFDPAHPLEGGLVLAGPDRQNPWEILRFRDVLPMAARADLVVLSACETGMAVEAGPDGLAGFHRALSFAGVGGVVSSVLP